MLMIRKARRAKLPPLDKNELVVARAFMAASRAVQAATNRAKLTAALEVGDIETAMAAIKWDAAAEPFLSVLPKQYALMHQLGRRRARRILRQVKKAEFGYAFGQTAPGTTRYAQERAGALIEEWGATSEAALRALIQRALREGMPIRDLVRLIMESGIGLTKRQQDAKVNYRKALEEQGVTGTELNRRVEKYGEQLLRRRAETIARTEISAAQIAGQQDEWKEALKDGLIGPEAVQIWDATGACDDCKEVEAAGKDGVKIGEVFPGTDVTGPPLHPNCRCGLNLRP